jgi:butyryl-CoA dehydrogenase
VLENGRVRVHPSVELLLRECGQGGWIGAEAPAEHGGQELPRTVMTTFRAILAAANYSTSVFPALTAGAAHLLAAYGSKELAAIYLPKMYAGQWQGTMALTEPQGLSLADIRTTASPSSDGLRSAGTKFHRWAGTNAQKTGQPMLADRRRASALGSAVRRLIAGHRERCLEDNDVTCTSGGFLTSGAPITEPGDAGDRRGWLVQTARRPALHVLDDEVGMGATRSPRRPCHAASDYARRHRRRADITSKDPRSRRC